MKIETYKVTKVKICLIKYKDQKEIFFLPPKVAVAVLVCLRSYQEQGKSQDNVPYFDE